MVLNENYTRQGRIFIRQGKDEPFNYNDGNEVEDYLLNIIEQSQDLSVASPYWHQHVRDWPTKYHLSPQRADLLRPFEKALKGKTVLEIGSGCGAITRFLAESGAVVTSLEGSPRRATITAARCRDLENVTVICDNFRDFELNQQFDFVVLVGVLEYSNLFIGGEQPVQQMLKKCKGFLRGDGCMLIAIENKLGLKYWAGAPEDHTGKPYFGIENQYNENTAETFGKAELRQLLINAGLSENEFLYPFPDYKLPSIILRDGALESKHFDVKNLLAPATDHPQAEAYYPGFVAERAWKQVISNELADEFANSFLVAASPLATDHLLPADEIGYIYSSGRYAAYRKANVFSKKGDDISISRYLINPGYPQRTEAILKQKIETEQYIDGEIFFLGFQQIISTHGWSIADLVEWAKPYYSYLLSLSAEMDGQQMLDGKYLDLTPFNLILALDGMLRHFDQEWITDEKLPLHYLLFRGLYFCFSRPLYYRASKTGTPTHAFGLITEIITALGKQQTDDSTNSPGSSAFDAPLNSIPVALTGISGQFQQLEKKYFGPVSPVRGYMPEDFSINFFPETVLPAQQVQGLSLHPLNSLQLTCRIVNPASSKVAQGSAFMQLSTQRHACSLQVEVLHPELSTLELTLSDAPGIVNLHNCVVTDDTGRVRYEWNTGSGSMLTMKDIVSLQSYGDSHADTCILFDGKPALVIPLNRIGFTKNTNRLNISVQASIVPAENIESLKPLLSGLLMIDHNGTEESHARQAQQEPDAVESDQGVRNRLSDLVHRLSVNARRDLDQQISQKNTDIEQLEINLADRITELERLKKEEEKFRLIQAENEKLKQDLNWYSSTYEKRSLLGVIWTRIRNLFRNIYLWFLHFIIGRRFVQNRFAIKHMLEYSRDNGLGNSLKEVRGLYRVHGLKTFTGARQLALQAISKAASARAPKPVEPATEDLYPLAKMIDDIDGFATRPLVSVIMPTYNTKPSLLEMAIGSVMNQVYENWELCIVDDGSVSAETKAFLKKYQQHPKIKLLFLAKNSGISNASNEARKLATGEYTALFDHDDELSPDALFWIVKEINEDPQVDIIYTDECKKNEAGEKSDYFLKPAWSPQLLLNMMYVGHLTVYRTKFLDEKVGLFRPEYDFSQDYDLVLRATEQTTNIRHIPKVLYYWRQTEGSASLGDKPYARLSNIRALQDAVQRRNWDAEVIELPTANRVKLRLTEQPLVSIIIPTDSQANLTATIDSIAASTSYKNFEIVPVTNSGLIEKLENNYPQLSLNLVRYDRPYNFSDKCNEGARGCAGSIVLFLNDDVRPLQQDWIENTIEYLQLPGIGGVSPKLIYEDDSIQYAGMITGVRNLTGTSFHCYPKDSTAYINFPQLTREVSILSGACLAMKKDLFLEIEGFDAINTPSAHSDVDLSFKIIEAGYRCLYTPYATLRHIGHLSLASYEEKHTKLKKDKADIFLLNRWPSYVSHDPYFPPSMRDLLYHDSPVPMSISAGRVKPYLPGNKDVMLVCHDLTRSGAPIMLYNICTVLLNNGYFVVVCCAKDGPLRNMYTELGVTVIIDPLILANHHSFEKFAINFDYIICNTVVNWQVVRQMQDKVKTIWWLQEAKVIDHFINEPGFVETLSTAKNIIGVSDYSLNMVRKYNRHYQKIYNACYDFYEPAKHDSDLSGRIRFAIVGSIESRKGHDVLFEALSYLDEKILSRIQVRVVGRVLDPAFNAMIAEKITGYDFISFTGEISNQQAVAEVADADVIVCPSRDDPFPVVLVEGFCMAKTCIVSDATGFAELIRQGESGYVFESENAKQLASTIRALVESASTIETIGSNARAIYEQELSIPVLEKRLLSYLAQMPAAEQKPSRKIHSATSTVAAEPEESVA